MAEAPHGTAPALEGKDIANPMGMILAARRAAPLRGGARRRRAERASRAVYEAVLETAAAGIRTPDLGGHAGTTEFTDAVIMRARGRARVRRADRTGAMEAASRLPLGAEGSRTWPAAERRGRRAGRRSRRPLVILGVLVLVMVAAKGLHDVAQTGLNGLSHRRDLRARRGRPDARLRDPQARQLRPRRLPHLRRLHGLPGQRHLGRARWCSAIVFGDGRRPPLLGVLLEKVMWGPMRAQRRRPAAAAADVDRARAS